MHMHMHPKPKRSSSRLTRDQTSNPTSSTNTIPKGRNRRSSKQRVENSNHEEHLPPVVTMADNRTMAELLCAPTEGYAKAIVVPLILAEQFELKHNQDSLNAAAGGNLLERSTQDVLTIIENKSKVRNSQSKPIASQVKDYDTNPNSEIAKLTHAVNQQTSAMTTAMTTMLKQFQATPPLAPVKAVEEIYVTCEGAHPHYQCLAVGVNTFPEFRDNIQGYVSVAAVNYNQGNPVYRPQGVANQMRPPGSRSLPSNTIANSKGELKDITTRSGLVTDGPTISTPPKSITPEVDERVEETYTNPDLAEYTIKVPPPLVQKYKPPELKCKALADLGASINLIPLSVWKVLGLPEIIPTRMTLELANRIISTPAGIARDVFVPVGKFTFPVNFVIVDYESDPRVPLILGRPFLRTARTLINVHGKEMILHDGDERLTLNMRHDTSSYSNQPQRELVNLINIFNVSKGCNILSEKLLDLHSTNDPYPSLDDNPLSGSTTYSSNSFLKEFTDELALITYPSEYDDNLQFDIEFDLKEIEFLLYQNKDSSLKDSIDQKDLADLDDIFVDPVPEMFTDEHAPDYLSPSIFDVYDDDFLEVESEAKNDKKLAISNSSLVLEDFDPPFYEPLFFKEVPKSKMLHLFSSENEEKVFKPEIYTYEKELPDIDSFNDIHPYFDDDPLSGSTTYSANSLLEEFADELALISYPPDYDDYRVCDIESDIREIEFLLFQGEDSDLKDSIDQSVLTHCDDLFVDPTPEMFAEEQPPDYSFLPRFDVYPDDFLEIESDATFNDDSFDSEGEKIKEAELLIDPLDLPFDILDDVLFSPDNENKVFNPGILSHEKSVKIITHVTQEKKLAVSFASWLFEDFDPPFSELLVFKEVPNSMRLLPFSSENKEKVFKPVIYTFKKFHCCFLTDLSHPGFPVFKVNLIFLSLMKIFHVQSGKNTPLLDVLLFHFYPP
nr:reverse transcriptase domain-containing protein [Tanacetum cinerariifolium]